MLTDQLNRRLYELDTLRAIAAMGIVIAHYNVNFGAAPLPQLFQPFYDRAFNFVDFFFLLSGFVLARTYWTEGRKNSCSRTHGSASLGSIPCTS